MKYLISTLLFFVSISIYSQVGIGTTTPNADALLDVDATVTNGGILLPRLGLSATTSPAPLTADVAGMIVYNTATAGDVTPGFYYNDGNDWIRLGAGGAAGWELLGNAGTTAGTNYIGTSDNVDLHISRQGSDQIRLTASELVFNENSDDRDLRIESNTNTALLLVDAGTDRVMVNSLGGAFTNTNLQASTSNGNIALLGSSFSGAGIPGYFQAQTASTAPVGLASFANNGAIAILADNDAVANGDDTFVSRSNSEEGFGAGWFFNLNDDDASGLGTAEATYGILSDVAGAGEYHMGVYGKSLAAERNTMGVYGNITTPGGGTFTTNGAGALGYREDGGGGGRIYGGYFEGDDGGHINGTFRTSGNQPKEQTTIGFGAKGGLMGGWTKGSVYGLATEGKRFSLYVNGREFTNDVITQLNESNKTERIATYVPTSTTVDITSKGVSKLSNGKKRVSFKDDFSQLSSSKEPIIVTVTPLGKSNGVYIESIDANGFTIIENNNGTANVQFTWIAIATRKGYESVKNPEELLAQDYDEKLSKTMNANILNNNKVEGQEMWWDGNKIQYSNTPEPKYNAANSVKAKSSEDKVTPLKAEDK